MILCSRTWFSVLCGIEQSGNQFSVFTAARVLNVLTGRMVGFNKSVESISCIFTFDRLAFQDGINPSYIDCGYSNTTVPSMPRQTSSVCCCQIMDVSPMLKADILTSLHYCCYESAKRLSSDHWDFLGK